MAGVKRGNPAGFAYMQFGLLDSTGICTGQSSAPSDGDTSHMLRVQGGTGAGFNPQSPTNVEFRDADAVAGNMQFGGGNQGPFQITVDEVSATAIALAGESSVDETTSSVWDIFATNPKNVDLPDMCVILAQKFQSRESGTSGLTKWLNHIIPVCNIRTLAGGPAYQASSPWTFEVNPRYSGQFPNGVSFGTNQNWTDNETDVLWMVTEKPLALTYHQGNTTATFVTGYRPFSSVVTLAASPNWYTEDGVAEAPTTVATATGVVTPDVAVVAGVKAVIIYETEFTAI